MIRTRSAEDFQGCVSLLREVHLADGYPANWPRHPSRWLAGHGGIAAWVGAQGERLIGHLALHLAEPAKAWPQWCESLGVTPESLVVVSRFFVSPGCRERGVGAALMARAEAHASALGSRLVLDVADDNHAAVAFYEHRGWRRVGSATLPPGDEGRPLRLLLFVADA